MTFGDERYRTHRRKRTYRSWPMERGRTKPRQEPFVLWESCCFASSAFTSFSFAPLFLLCRNSPQRAATTGRGGVKV